MSALTEKATNANRKDTNERHAHQRQIAPCSGSSRSSSHFSTLGIDAGLTDDGRKDAIAKLADGGFGRLLAG
jgi:hypothetical protein